METPNQNYGKNMILIVSPNELIRTEMERLLSDKYIILFADDRDGGMALLEKHYDYIAAILVETSIAAADGGSTIKAITEEPKFMFIPVILVSDKLPPSEEVDLLSTGAVDILVAPFHKLLTHKRIENAIRIKDSASFYEIERMLKALPSNIYLKDADGKYIFATQYWHHLDHGDDPTWTIRGKTDVDIRKDKENAIAAMEADKEIIRTGKGTSYVIEINTDGLQEFYELIKQPVWDDNNKVIGIVGLINNVTEQEKLRHKLKYAAETDGLTGLLNRAVIQSVIEERLCALKDGGMGFSLIMLDIDNFKHVNDTYGHKQGDNVIKALADILHVRTSNIFYAGRWGGEEFMVLVCGYSLEMAVKKAEEIRINFMGTEYDGVPPQTVSVGVAEASESDTVDTLCTRVDMCLYNSKKSGKNRVMTTIREKSSSK